MNEKITCLCPTYGRFDLLRNSLSCFLSQTYENKELLILNDAKVPIQCDYDSVVVINKNKRFNNLGLKRQFLLEKANSKFVAHWDDDDLYLPWHLDESIKQLHESGRSCVKPKKAWFLTGTETNLSLRGLRSNVFEGMIVFDRAVGVAYGGYTPRVSGQCLQLISKFKQSNDYQIFTPEPSFSYAYRWNNGKYHIQGAGNTKESHQNFAKKNKNFGEGKGTLTPNDLSYQRKVFIEEGGRYLPNDIFTKFVKILKNKW